MKDALGHGSTAHQARIEQIQRRMPIAYPADDHVDALIELSRVQREAMRRISDKMRASHLGEDFK